MKIQDRVEQVRQYVAASGEGDKEAITMLLSACSDKGSSDGCLLSVKAFDNAADHILLYLKSHGIGILLVTEYIPAMFNYVNVVAKGGEGWLNLFFGDHALVTVYDVRVADEIRKVIPKRAFMTKGKWRDEPRNK